MQEQEEAQYFDEPRYLQKKEANKWQSFTPKIFALFWQLELQDLVLPRDHYEAQIQKKEREATRPRGQGETSDEQAKRERMAETQRKDLKHELEQIQAVRHLRTTKWLKENLAGMFEEIEDELGVSQFLIQHCLYPRLMFSPGDAIFCIKFVQMLVICRVPKVNILNVLA